MSSFPNSILVQSPESLENYGAPRHTTHPYSPLSPSYTLDHTTLEYPWGVLGGLGSVAPLIALRSDEELDGFENSFNLISGKIPFNSEYVDFYRKMGTDGWPTNRILGHSQPQTTHEHNQVIVDDTAVGEGISSYIDPHDLDNSSAPSNITPGPTGHRTPEMSEGVFPVEKVSTKINRAKSTSREFTLGAGDRGSKHRCELGCGKKFSRRTDEKRHRRDSCPRSEEKRQKPLRCGQCGTAIKRLDNLKQHTNRVTKRCRLAGEERAKAA